MAPQQSHVDGVRLSFPPAGGGFGKKPWSCGGGGGCTIDNQTDGIPYIWLDQLCVHPKLGPSLIFTPQSTMGCCKITIECPWTGFTATVQRGMRRVRDGLEVQMGRGGACGLLTL